MFQVTEISLKKLKKTKLLKRKHSKQQIQSCCKSLQKHGQYQPIIVSQNEILCGNLVYDAAKILKYKKLSIIELGHLSEEKKKEIRFLDNHTFELSNWKDNALKELLMMLDIEQMQEYGFTQDDSYRIINDLDDQSIKISDLQKDLGIKDTYYCPECGWQGTIQEIEVDEGETQIGTNKNIG